MKQLISMLLALVLLCSAAALADGLVIAGDPPVTGEDRPMVVDSAHILSADEEQEVREIVSRIRNDYQMDAVVLTVRLSRKSDSALQDYADCWFEENGYGLRGNYSGALLMDDMGNRYVHLSTSGDMIDFLTDSRVDKILDAFSDEVSRSSDYGKGIIAALKKLETYLSHGREDGSFRYDALTGKRLSGIYNKITTTEVILSLAVGLGVLLAVRSRVNRRYGMKKKTYQFNKSTQSSVIYTVNDVVFIRETVHRIPHSSGSSGGSGHSGGHSGGSSVHVSSSGGSHGGGGRHF